MATGIVKFFSNRKGFGFITDDDGGDFFVHVRDLRESGLQTLPTGEAVSFDLGTRCGRTHAINVKVSGRASGPHTLHLLRSC